MAVAYSVDSFVPDNLDYAPLTSPVVMGKARKAMIEAQGFIFIVDIIIFIIFLVRGFLMIKKTHHNNLVVI